MTDSIPLPFAPQHVRYTVAKQDEENISLSLVARAVGLGRRGKNEDAEREKMKRVNFPEKLQV